MLPRSLQLCATSFAALVLSGDACDASPLRWVGGDMSAWASQGDFFVEAGGQASDPFQHLADNGATAARLRIWNDPSLVAGNPPGSDLEGMLASARRANLAGLAILVDFHYSDTWADPGKQRKPKSWEGLPLAELADAVRAYTGDVVSRLIAQGTPPALVQVGNEVANGLLWDEDNCGNGGKLWGACGSNFGPVATLLNAGLAGVHDASAEAWPTLFSGGYCSVGWIDGTADASKRDCEAACAADGACGVYCHGPGGAEWSCLRYTSQCDRETKATVLDGHDKSAYSCYSRPEVESRAETVIHLESGSDASGVVWWFQEATKAGLAGFDNIGLSYYPRWSGLDASPGNLTRWSEIARAFPDKGLLMCETDYVYETPGGGSWPDPPLFPYTPDGQEEYLEAVLRALDDVPQAKGMFWWGTEILGGYGGGRSAMWDERGVLLPVASGFRAGAQLV